MYRNENKDQHFNPRSPWGERQQKNPWKDVSKYFNPRSPWGERRSHSEGLTQGPNFNPRSPWGERQVMDKHKVGAIIFQSTLPVGGATGLL